MNGIPTFISFSMLFLLNACSPVTANIEQLTGDIIQKIVLEEELEKNSIDIIKVEI